MERRAGGPSVRAGGEAPGTRLLKTGWGMRARPFVDYILACEALTRGLGDAEARVLIEWLVDEVERMAEEALAESLAWQEVERLCRRMRAIGRFVGLWCHRATRGAAHQLAAAERFAWPLPGADMEPSQLMATILEWESIRLRDTSASAA